MKAIILLHEIYGWNPFMDAQRRKLEKLGFAVFCPDFYGGCVFGYEETEQAYTCFYEQVGLEAFRRVWEQVDILRKQYESVYILGFSVGATLAWRCSENRNCAGVIACYGSRIREYPEVMPRCPTLLLFAEKDSFDVPALAGRLEQTPNTRVRLFPGEHGFLDPDSGHYHGPAAKEAEAEILRFLLST